MPRATLTAASMVAVMIVVVYCSVVYGRSGVRAGPPVTGRRISAAPRIARRGDTFGKISV